MKVQRIKSQISAEDIAQKPKRTCEDQCYAKLSVRSSFVYEKGDRQEGCNR